MGQKIIPISLRLNTKKNWHSQWIVEKKNYAELLHFDLEIRKYIESLFIKEHLKILKININKISKNLYIYVFLENNRIIQKKRNVKIKKSPKFKFIEKKKLLFALNNYLNNKYNIKLFILNSKFNLIQYKQNTLLIYKYLKKNNKITFNLKRFFFVLNYAIATKKINMISKLIKFNLENKKIHKGFLRFFNKILINFFKINSNLLGYRLQIKGRINGVKRKKKLLYQQGKIPLTTLKNNIQYTFDEFNTKSGICSIKLWFFFKDLKKNYYKKPIYIFKKKKIIIKKKKFIKNNYNSELFRKLLFKK